MNTILLIMLIVLGTGYIVERERRQAQIGAIKEAIDWLKNVDKSYANGNTHNGVDEGEFYGNQGEIQIIHRLEEAVK